MFIGFYQFESPSYPRELVSQYLTSDRKVRLKKLIKRLSMMMANKKWVSDHILIFLNIKHISWGKCTHVSCKKIFLSFKATNALWTRRDFVNHMVAHHHIQKKRLHLKQIKTTFHQTSLPKRPIFYFRI